MRLYTTTILSLLCLLTWGQDTSLATKIDLVTIYHNGALIERTAQVNLSPGTQIITVNNVSSKLVLNSVKINNREVTVLNKELVRTLSDEQYEVLLDEREALQAQLNLLESKYTEAGFVQKVDELERMIQYYGQKIKDIKRATRLNERRLAEAKKLADIKLDNKDAAILRLTISSASALSGQLRLQYVAGGIGWSPAYDIAVEQATQDHVQMKYLAKVMNQTGEDWRNVKIQLSSASPFGDPITLPLADNPWVLSSSMQQQRQMSNAGAQGVYNIRVGSEHELAQLTGVQYQQISVPSFLKTRSLEGRFNIPSNGTIFSYPIFTQDIPARFYYYGYPSIDPEVYLVAELSGWSTLGLVDGMASISYAGSDVGRSMIAFSEVEETIVLPIGRDNSVYLDRSEMANEKYFKETWSGKKRKSTQAYELTVRNNNGFPISFKLIDQLPISQTKSAEVDVETLSGAELDPATGELVWMLDLGSSDSSKKQLIYTIDMDASYKSNKSKSRSRQYRTINAPSF